MSERDPNAGRGGSYIRHPDGTRTLVGRTREGEAPDVPEPVIDAHQYPLVDEWAELHTTEINEDSAGQSHLKILA